MTRLPVLLDTDPGSDIDDALAISYLLRQSRCELLGITTVSGDRPEERAELVAAICADFGRDDVPVHVGSPGPLLPGFGPGQPHCPQFEALKGRTLRGFERGTAVEFMRRTILERPGEITLLAIGPFTNVALLFAMDPRIPSLLRELVIMGGVFSERARWACGPGAREWNALCDPLATAVMFAARPPAFRCIGLDVTTHCQRDAEACRRDFAELPTMGLAAEMAEVWFRGQQRKITFHDPLAAATIFEPDLCTWADGTVRVETDSRPLGGLTQFDGRTEEKPHRVAMEVDAPRFFEHYFATLRNETAVGP